MMSLMRGYLSKVKILKGEKKKSRKYLGKDSTKAEITADTKALKC